MREWHVIFLIAAVALAAGLLLLRQRPLGMARSSASEARLPPDADAAAPISAAISVGPGRDPGLDPPEVQAGPVRVPNTRILPHPDDRPVGLLEFSGARAPVSLRRGEVVIGRHSSDDIHIPDVRVSRHHARLLAHPDGGVEIHNLTADRPTTNPVLVNGVAKSRASVDDGDVITLGGVSFTFRRAGP